MLYIVGTPIGNLKDITQRAIEVLKEVDFIACEDTRHSGILLNLLGIKKPLISYYKQKEKESGEKIISLLEEGKNVALISDAGMPCISDPGSVVVTMARKKGLDISVVPGPSAMVSAFALSGLSGGFVFIGFLAEKTKDKDLQLDPFLNSPLPLLFYCGPHDVNKYIAYLYQKLGNRPLYAVKEITKIYEGVEVSTLEKGLEGEIKGEYVLIVGGAEKTNSLLDLTPEEHLKYYLSLGLDKKDAVKRVASERGVNKDVIYKLTLK